MQLSKAFCRNDIQELADNAVIDCISFLPLRNKRLRQIDAQKLYMRLCHKIVQ
jgi:hypothetical protein